MSVARNVMVDGRLVPGGGAVEMALAHVSIYQSNLNLLFLSLFKQSLFE